MVLSLVCFRYAIEGPEVDDGCFNVGMGRFEKVTTVKVGVHDSCKEGKKGIWEEKVLGLFRVWLLLRRWVKVCFLAFRGGV